MPDYETIANDDFTDGLHCVTSVFFSEKSKFSFNQMICALVCWNSNHFFLDADF